MKEPPGFTYNSESDSGDVDVPLSPGHTHIVSPVSGLYISHRQHSFSIIMTSATKFLTRSVPRQCHWALKGKAYNNQLELLR